MASLRHVTAVFSGAAALATPERRGLVLSFDPERARVGMERIEDFADLGPELTVPAVEGVGKVMRLLRAARLATPAEPNALMGAEEQLAARLARARGMRVRLALRPRSRVRFLAWTEAGLETVNDVVDVVESPAAWLVMRRHGHRPVRVARADVVRQRTETVRWFEIVDIARV